MQRLYPLRLWSTILFVTVVVATVGIWCFTRVEQAQRTELASALATVRNGATVGLSIWLDDKQGVAKTWANEAAVRKFVADHLALAESGATPAELRVASTMTQLRNHLRPVCAEYNFIGFVLVNSAGVNVGALLDEPIGLSNLSNLSERAEFISRVLAGETLVTPPFPASIALPDAAGELHCGQPTMFTASPIRDAEGNVIAVLAFRIRPEAEFASILTTARLGETGETYAFDAAGLMLSHSRFEEQLIHLGLVHDRPGEDTILQLRLRDPGRDLRDRPYGSTLSKTEQQRPLTLALRSAVQGITASDVQGYRDYRGVPVIGAWAWLPQHGFGVVTELDLDEAYARLADIHLGVLTVVSLLLATVAVGAMLAVFNRRHTNSLERMASLSNLLRTMTVDVANSDGLEDALRASATRIASWGSMVVDSVHLGNSQESKARAPGTISLPILSGDEQTARIEFLVRPGKKVNGSDLRGDLELISAALSRSLEHLRVQLLLKETLRELEMQKRAFDLSAIVTKTDVRGNITYANDAFCEISGYSRAELIGQNHRLIKSDEHSPEFYEGMWRTISRGGVWRGEVKNKRKDGSFYWVYATIVPFLNSRAKPDHYVAIRVDITERKLLERQLSHSQKLESIGQLAAGIAHEINTPTQFVGDNTLFLEESFRELTPLLNMAEKLAEAINKTTESSELAEELKAALENVDVQYLIEEIPSAIEQSLFGIDRVRKIVQSMKEFSHPGAEGMSRIDLNHAIESTIMVASNEWKYVAEMETDFDLELPTVPCLPGELNQVVLNIIVNAAHAIGDVGGDGEGMGTITISTRQDGEFVEVRIADTGTGIPEEARGRVFDPFFTTKEIGKGTGQGLSIAYGVVVKKHGGTLDFETEMGKGTTFVIRLPLENQVA